jgi:chromosome segregation ATPase
VRGSEGSGALLATALNLFGFCPESFDKLATVAQLQVEEFKRLLKVEKDATIRAQSSEAEAKSEADRIRGQIKTIRDELMAAATDGRAARKETVDATTLAGGLKGEILVLKEQLAEFEMERVRQREHYDRTRGELDKARGEALQMRELNDGLRERVAQVETQVRAQRVVSCLPAGFSHARCAQLSEAKSEPFKMQGQIDELKSQLDESRDVLHRVEADADLQRRERDRLKGQLVEIKSQLASMRQQVTAHPQMHPCDAITCPHHIRRLHTPLVLARTLDAEA